MPAHRPSPRGFTLVELLVSLVVLMSFVVMAGVALQTQGRAVTRETARQAALHGARAVTAAVERELRVAGTNLAPGQPLIVEAGPRSIVFNTDLVSPLPGDPFASFVNPSADSGTTGVWLRASALELPATARSYPETTYVEGPGTPGAAETIAYWVVADSTAPRADEHLLFRRVNAAAPEVMARGIVLGADDTIFRYFRPDSLGVMREFPPAALPLHHRAPIHGSRPDTGASARADSVRMVTVTLSARSFDPRGPGSVRTSRATIRIVNAAAAGRTTCGETPIGVSPAATVATDAGGARVVRVTWSRALDDGAGERDVQRYVIYRRLAGAPAFDDPLASVPAGGTSFTFTDSDVLTGQQLVYGVAAQDCTPAMSAVGLTTTVTVP